MYEKYLSEIKRKEESEFSASEYIQLVLGPLGSVGVWGGL
jgi:hypothetical protein